MRCEVYFCGFGFGASIGCRISGAFTVSGRRWGAGAFERDGGCVRGQNVAGVESLGNAFAVGIFGALPAGETSEGLDTLAVGIFGALATAHWDVH